MAPRAPSSDDDNSDTHRTTSVVELGSTPREDHLLQGIASLHSQLDAMSQRQEELMRLIGAPPVQRDRTTPGPPYGTRTDANLAPGPLSNEAPESLLPAGGAGGEIPTLNPGHIPVPRRPYNLPSQHYPIPGRPQVPLRTFPSQGQPLIPSPAPVFYVVDLVRQGPFIPRPNSYTGAIPGVRQAPPPVYPRVQSRVRPHMLSRVTPQRPHQTHVQMPPEIATETQGPSPMDSVVLRGPPPPYPEPVLSFGNSMPGRSQASPSTTQHRAPGTSGISEIIQTTTLWMNDDDIGSRSNVQPAPRLKRAGSSSTRAKRPRKDLQRDLP